MTLSKVASLYISDISIQQLEVCKQEKKREGEDDNNNLVNATK
jgi:hypothetical protein